MIPPASQTPKFPRAPKKTKPAKIPKPGRNPTVLIEAAHSSASNLNFEAVWKLAVQECYKGKAQWESEAGSCGESKPAPCHSCDIAIGESQNLEGVALGYFHISSTFYPCANCNERKSNPGWRPSYMNGPGPPEGLKYLFKLPAGPETFESDKYARLVFHGECVDL